MLLGELLVREGLASPADIKNALALQEHFGGRIGNHLVDLGIISREPLEAALRRQYERAMAVLAREDLLARAERRHGPDHPRTHRQRCLLAQALIAAGRLDDALALAQRAYEGHLDALGYEHYWTIDSEQTVVEAAAALNAAMLPGEGPAITARIGAGEQDGVAVAIVLPADDLDAARPVEIADRVDGVAAPA